MHNNDSIKDMISKIGYLYSGNNYNIYNGVFASYDINPSREKDVLSMYFEDEMI